MDFVNQNLCHHKTSSDGNILVDGPTGRRRTFCTNYPRGQWEAQKTPWKEHSTWGDFGASVLVGNLCAKELLVKSYFYYYIVVRSTNQMG